MSIQPIRLFGDPVLRTRAEPVVDFDAELRRLVKDLTDTMLDAPGAGLAAPQIGVALQACVVEVEDTLHELVNPRIVRSTGDDTDLEGCRSIPGWPGWWSRATATVRYPTFSWWWRR